MNAKTSMTSTRVILTYPFGTHDKSNAFFGDPVLCSRPTPRREIGDDAMISDQALSRPPCSVTEGGGGADGAVAGGRTGGGHADERAVSRTVLSRADVRPAATQMRTVSRRAARS